MKKYNPLNNKNVNYAAIGLCPTCARRLTNECSCVTDMETEEWRAAYLAAEQMKANEQIEPAILARLPFDHADHDILAATRTVAPNAAMLTSGAQTELAYGTHDLGTRCIVSGGEVLELDSHLEAQYDEQNGDIDMLF